MSILLFIIISTVCDGQYATSHSEPNTELPRHEVVDHIENIEIDATQIIITTTKNGPIENLKVHIELVDIEANKKVNPVDLGGLWLTITRGRYTIPFLRPDTWYGVRFRCENTIDGRKIVHEDERLIKTKTREEPMVPVLTLPPPIVGFPTSLGIGAMGSHAEGTTEDAGTAHEPDVHHEADDEKDILDVKMHRSLDGVETYESLYVTVSWKKKEGRSNSTTGVVKFRVKCENTETNEEIRIKGDEDAVTIEITMDQRYDIEEMDKSKNQIRAKITPLKCHKVCWNSDLMLSSEFGDFKKHIGEDCKDIEGTTSVTYLREIKKVAVLENELSINELIVETEVAESEYGVVTLWAQRLGLNETELERKAFDTTKSNGKFVYPLEDDAFYAIKYEYVKNRPFHYTSKSLFLAESPAPNSTRASHQLVDISVMPKSFDFKHEDTTLKPEPPYLLVSRSPYYASHDLLIHIEPFCHENATNIRLEDRYPEHQIDGVPFLCSLEPTMYFCNHNITYTKCDSALCFSISLLIGQDSYNSETRCLNVTQHFPPLLSTSSTNAFSFIMLLLILFLSAQ